MDPGWGLIHPCTQPGEGDPKAAKLGDALGGGSVGGAVGDGMGVVDGSGDGVGVTSNGEGVGSSMEGGGDGVDVDGGTPIMIGVRSGRNVVIATGSG